MSRTLLALTVLSATSGCYLAHERPAPDRGARDGAPLAVDASTSPRDDAWRDPSVLPPDPEPDAEVDQPPDAWRADAATPRHVVLTTVGDPIIVDDLDDGGWTPSLAWDGHGWGLVWVSNNTNGVRLRRLDEDAAPIGPSTVVAEYRWPGAAVVDFAIGRYAVVTANGDAAALHLLDRNARAVPPSAPISPTWDGDVARLESAHQWIVASRTMSTPADVVVETIDDDMRERDARITLHVDLPDGVEDDGPVRVASLKTRAVVAWVTAQGLEAAVFTGAPLTQVSPILDLGPLAGAPDREDLGIALVPFGDRIVVAAPDGTGIEAFFVDPWASTVRGPFAVGETGISDRPSGIASAPEHGMFGVCWPQGRGPGGGSEDMSDGFSMRVLDESGMPLSDTLAVVEHLSNAGGVDCGWDGTDFVIVWWRASRDNQLFSQRVHPSFE